MTRFAAAPNGESCAAGGIGSSGGQNAGSIVKMMQKQYPDLAESGSLELGAKVVKGEVKWP